MLYSKWQTYSDPNWGGQYRYHIVSIEPDWRAALIVERAASGRWKVNRLTESPYAGRPDLKTPYFTRSFASAIDAKLAVEAYEIHN